MSMEDLTNGSQDPLDEQLLEASRLSDAGEEQAALQLLLGLEPEHSENATLLCMIGALAAQLGVEGMAVDYFKRCLALDPTDPGVLVTAGAGLAASGDPAAEPALRLAALTAPDYAAARMHYGAYLVRNGLVEQGIEELLTALGLEEGDPDIHYQLGVAYLVAGRVNEALDELETAARASEDPEMRFLLGLALIQQGEIGRAAEELHPIAEAFAHDPDAQVLLALAFAAEGWEDEAWLAVSRAESGEAPVDGALIREVEEALEEGAESSRSMLIDEVAPASLRDRIAGG